MAEGKVPLVGAGYSKKSGMYLNLFIYITVFSGLVIALRYAGSLELGTVSSVEHNTTSQVSSSSGNMPPEAVYVKTPIQELKIKTSSFKVCEICIPLNS